MYKIMIFAIVAAATNSIELGMAGDSNVVASNNTNSAVTIRFNYVVDRTGTKTTSSYYWELKPGASVNLIINEGDLLLSEVGYRIENSFGVQTPTDTSKVWSAKQDAAEPAGQIRIVVSDKNVYRLPEDRNMLEAMLQKTESSVETLNRDVLYYKRLMDAPNDDFVLTALHGANYFGALERYQKALSLRQAIAAKLGRLPLR